MSSLEKREAEGVPDFSPKRSRSSFGSADGTLSFGYLFLSATRKRKYALFVDYFHLLPYTLFMDQFKHLLYEISVHAAK